VAYLSDSYYSIGTAVEAIREGAADYICKPISPEKLRAFVEQAQQLGSSRTHTQELEKELTEAFSFRGNYQAKPDDVIGLRPDSAHCLALPDRAHPGRNW